jgi:L-asparaginase
MLDGLPALNYAGAVIEGMGAGHIPADAVPRVVALMKTMPVVLSTRVRSGPVFTQTYGFDGSEIDLIRRGAIPSGMIGAQKARMLLSLLLSSGQSREAIANTFSAFSDI